MRYGIKGNPHLHPVCAQQGDDNSDTYWECLIRHLTQTVFHPTGTCKMGPASDKGAVVDPQLRFVKVFIVHLNSEHTHDMILIEIT